MLCEILKQVQDDWWKNIMKLFDFIYYVGFHSANKNGFSDAREMYGKIVLSAIIFFLFIAFGNVLYLLGFKELLFEGFVYYYFIFYGIELIITFFVYKKRGAIALSKFNLSQSKVRIYFNLLLFTSLLLLFLTTITIGPLYEK